MSIKRFPIYASPARSLAIVGTGLAAIALLLVLAAPGNAAPGTGRELFLDGSGDASPTTADLTRIGAYSTPTSLVTTFKVNTAYPTQVAPSSVQYRTLIGVGTTSSPAAGACWDMRLDVYGGPSYTTTGLRNQGCKVANDGAATPVAFSAAIYCNEVHMIVPMSAIGITAPGTGTVVQYGVVTGASGGGVTFTGGLYYSAFGTYLPGTNTVIDGPTGQPRTDYTIGSSSPMYQGAPTITVTPNGDNTVRIAWTQPDNGAQSVSAYKVYRSTTGAAGPFTLLTTTLGTATNYDDTLLATGSTYTYKVANVNCPTLPAQTAPPAGEPAYIGGESLRSAAVSVTPSFRPLAPTGLAVGTPTSTSLKLTWTAAIDCPGTLASGCAPAGSGASLVKGYSIWRVSPGPGGETFLVDTLATAACPTSPCAYINTALTAATGYCYTVRAYDNYLPTANVGLFSSEACGTTTNVPAPSAVADSFVPTIDTLFTAPTCSAGIPSATGGPYSGVICNDLDAANHVIEALLVSGPTQTSPGGSFALAAKGGFTYKAGTGFCGGAGDSFQYQLRDVTDGILLNTVTVQLSIACPGSANQPPVANPVTYNVYVDATLDTAERGPGWSLLVSASDPNPGDLLTASLCAGPLAGSLTNGVAATGHFEYIPAGATPYVTSFTYKVQDNLGVPSACAAATINVKVNAPPVADFTANSFAPAADDVVSFSDLSTDDGVLVAWAWDFGDATTSTLRSPQFGFLSPGQYTVTLRVTDDGGLSSSVSKVFTVGAIENQAPSQAPGSPPESAFAPADTGVAPVAEAGLDFASAGGNVVSLRGTANGQSSGFYFSWKQVAGPLVELSDSGAAEPSFTVPEGDLNDAVALVFELVVSDGSHTSAPKQVTVTIPPRGQAPIADAGVGQSAGAGESVTLVATSSRDPDGESLSYAWTQIEGPTVELSDASAESPTFTVPAGLEGALLVFRLNVTDGQATSTDTVQVVVKAAPQLAQTSYQAVAEKQSPIRLSQAAHASQGAPGVETGLAAIALLGIALVLRARRL